MSTIYDLLQQPESSRGTLSPGAVVTKVGKMDTAKNGQPWALFTIADATGETGVMWMPCSPEIGFAAGKGISSAPGAAKVEVYNNIKKLRFEGATALVLSVEPAHAPHPAPPASSAPRQPSSAPQVTHGRQHLTEAAVLAFIGRAAGPLATHLWTGIAEALMPPADRRGAAALAASLDGGAKYAPTPDALLASVQATLCTMLIAASRGEIVLADVDSEELPF